MLVSLRVSLELLAYYNAKMMYSSGTLSKISPLMVTYITHSIVAFLILQDLVQMRRKYFSTLQRETGLRYTKFLCFTFILSFIFNLSHVPKYFSLNKFTDLFIVSISCLSVIATHWLCVLTRRKSLTFTGITVTVIAFFGVFLLFGEECKTRDQWILATLLLVGSIFSGFYTVFMKIFMDIRYKNNKLEIVLENNETKQNTKKQAELETDHDTKKEKSEKTENCLKTEKEDVITEAEMKKNGKNRKQKIKVKKVAENNISKFVKKEKHHKKQSSNQNIPEQSNDSFNQKNNNNQVEMCVLEQHPFSKYKKNQEIIEFDHISKNLAQKIIYSFIYKINRKNVTIQQFNDLSFMRHYLGTTGILTLLFYWPMIILPLDTIKPSFGVHGVRLVIHIILSNIFSVLQNVLYFVLVTCRSPHFIQLSGMILQPTIICLEILMTMTCFTKRLVGFACIFSSLFFIG